MHGPLVIKVGGSLFPRAEEVIRVITSLGTDALLLPGGGLFANTIRTLTIGETPAHWMAIAAMEQYGWYLSGFGMETTDVPHFSKKPRIFLPYRYLMEHDPLPHSWEITSDTISAWLADHLGAGLIVLKSIDHIRAGTTPLDVINAPIRTDDLDPAFIPFILDHHLTGKIINGTNPDRIRLALEGMQVPGTSFGTTI